MLNAPLTITTNMKKMSKKHKYIILRCLCLVFDCRVKLEENLNFFVTVYLCLRLDDQCHWNVFPDK